MARNGAALRTYALGAALVLAVPPAASTATPAVPRPPLLTGCVFQNRANVTCHWEAGDAAATHYTLQVHKVLNKTDEHQEETYRVLQTFACAASRGSCTAGMPGSSVRFVYCVTVTAHARGGDAASAPRCQSGRTEVMLPPVTLGTIEPVTARPRCLNLSWSGALALFPVSKPEVRSGFLNSQIEFTAQGQLDAQVQNVTVTNFAVPLCFFRPDTSYTVRLRHRFQGPRSPWSPWSNAQQGRTAEDAPSAAPAFWRRIRHREENGWKRVVLLWKPLLHPVANGRVLYYNVTCQTERARVLGEDGGCGDLNHTRTSCSLLLPAGRCSCALTASTSAGTSPEARVWLRGPSDPEPPSVKQITAHALDEGSLEVRWAAPGNQSETGFVLEWFAVRDDTSTVLYWERLNSSCRALVITEGIKPEERYSVSVTVLYGEQGGGKHSTLHVYTVQGAPSAGPTLKVQQLSGGSVELSWRPVAVELRRGFIRNYTVCYSAMNQTAKCVFVPAHAHTCSLKSLLPGNYAIFMRSNTDAGAGAAGPVINVHIDAEERSVMIYTILPPVMMLLALVLMGCLLQNSIVKQKLCQDLPDPSHSTVAHWTPKTAGLRHSLVAERSQVKYSEVDFPADSEQQSCDADQEVYNLQTYAPTLRPQVHQNPRLLEPFSSGNQTGATATSRADLSSCDCIYSTVLPSQTLDNAPTPCMSHAGSSTDVEVQLGPGEEPPQPSKLKPYSLFLKQYETPGSLPDVTSVFTAEVTSLHQPFSQSAFNLASLLQLGSFSRPDAPSTNSSTSFSPSRALVLVDMPYCPVKCEPYASLVV
ncbi:interleukin-31 receptor subunit alpha isoform X2 [Betta splendens]|uniref:Interleukin-31 receptor subunit alpha isoform X2 n=1 Tax=Betta splendens TaxID=158456 RepID=A0A9W2XJN6_BETSP|nr:interleukin-31 receptor subunit alpha isoform X2 [Betta splendens]